VEVNEGKKLNLFHFKNNQSHNSTIGKVPAETDDPAGLDECVAKPNMAQNAHVMSHHAQISAHFTPNLPLVCSLGWMLYSWCEGSSFDPFGDHCAGFLPALIEQVNCWDLRSHQSLKCWKVAHPSRIYTSLVPGSSKAQLFWKC
jgi:hypothetical protein